MKESATDRPPARTEDLGTVLTLLRVANGLSQQALSEASGIGASTISEYERGKMIPGSTMLKKILDALGLPWMALDMTKGYLEGLDSQSLGASAIGKGVFTPTEALSALELSVDPDALRQETEQVLALAEKVFSRLIRLWFVPMFQGTLRLSRQQLLDILEVEEKAE